jgi:hypothetical protein
MEESPGAKHRKIMLHGYCRWVKSTLSDIGLSNFGEWMIGHQGSTYYFSTASIKLLRILLRLCAFTRPSTPIIQHANANNNTRDIVEGPWSVQQHVFDQKFDLHLISLMRSPIAMKSCAVVKRVRNTSNGKHNHTVIYQCASAPLWICLMFVSPMFDHQIISATSWH